MFLPKTEVFSHIVENPAPVIFIDTCVFLDILRSPIRKNISTDIITTTLKLIEMSEKTPREVWLLTNETVHGEWNDHINSIKLELEKEIKSVEIKREKLFLAAKKTLGQTCEYGQKETSINLHCHLESLSRNLLNNCLVMQVEDMHSVRAMQRIRKCLPPARKGKQEAKDCEILEAFLDISKCIRDNDLEHVICFISSNSDDYGKPEQSPIQQDFDSVNTKYVNNLQWALTLIENRT